MKKETLLEIILGTIGGLAFAIVMCMCLLQEWDMFIFGVIITIIGFVILLCIIPVYKSSHPNKIKQTNKLWNCFNLDSRCSWFINYGIWYE